MKSVPHRGSGWVGVTTTALAIQEPTRYRVVVLTTTPERRH